MDVRHGNPIGRRDWMVKSDLRLFAGAQAELTPAGEIGGNPMRFMPRVLVLVLGITLLLGFSIMLYGGNNPPQPPVVSAPPGYLVGSNRSEVIVRFWEPRPEGVSAWSETRTAGVNYLELTFEPILEPADAGTVTFR